MQKGLFAKLDKEFINYLGKHNRNQEGNETHKAIMKCISGTMNTRQCISKEEISSKDKLNVYSSEGLLALHHDINRPEKTYNLFSAIYNNITLLIVIRNQQDLLYSLFVHRYELIKNDLNISTMDRFISYVIDNGGLYNGLDFYTALNAYKRFFKGKIHVLLYEDLLYNKVNFLNQLSNILNIDFDILNDSIGEHHFYRKDRCNEGYYATLNNPAVDFVEKITNKQAIRKNICYKILQRTLPKKSILIPYLSEPQRNIVFNYFKDNNLDP